MRWTRSGVTKVTLCALWMTGALRSMGHLDLASAWLVRYVNDTAGKPSR